MTSLADQLYAALRTMPCRCQYGPWHNGARELIVRCARCVAIDRYEAENDVPVIEEDTVRWLHE